MIRNKKESFLKGVTYLLISQIIIKVIGFTYKFYLTNKPGFGDSGNAIYSSGFQIYALLLAFSSTGIPSAISKLVAERLAVGDAKGAHRIFKISMITFSILGIIGSILLFLGAKKIAKDWIQIPEAEYSLIALSPSIFFVSISSVFRGYFNGKQSFTATAKSQTIEQIFKTFFTIILVEFVVYIKRNNIYIMAGAANFATTIATVMSFIYIYYYYRSKNKEIAQEILQTVNYKVNRLRKTIKRILLDSIPISLGSLIASFNKNIDSLTVVRFLKKITNEKEAIAQYGILSGKIDILCSATLAINVAFVTAFVPSIVKSFTKNDLNNTYKKIKIFIFVTILVGIPITIIMMFLPKEVLNLFFPNANSGANYLRISSISIIFMLLTQTVNSILQALGKVNVPPISLSIGIIFKLICNVCLIPNPNFGILGAIIGNIVYNIISFFISITILIYLLYFQDCKNKSKKINCKNKGRALVQKVN